MSQDHLSKIMERRVRVDISRKGIKRITMLPLDDEGMRIMKKHDMDAESAVADVYDKLWIEDAGQLMDFVFDNAYSEYGLVVLDAETEEELYENDSFALDTSYGLMSFLEADAEFDQFDPDCKGEFTRYMNYLKSQCQVNELYLSQGFTKAWNELREPQTETADTFIPDFMRHSLSAAGANRALLVGMEERETVTISFYVSLPDGEDFDPNKLDIINIDSDYNNYSDVLQELLTGDIILLNAIIYDRKVYFAGHDGIDISYDSDEEPIFDYVDENMAHIE